MSWVILTERHAYKVKKAVDLGEAQFRSPAKRHAACVEEVWLNQRLAQGVYLGVVPITRGPRGQLQLGGKGVAVEWMVKMRRLRADQDLRSLISRGELSKSQVTALADKLAAFYHARPPETEQLDDLCARLHRRINDAAKQLIESLPAKTGLAVRRLRDLQSNFLANERMVLNLRVCDGRIVDGHGDLRPEHIFFERQPLIVDCIEYSANLRKLDALDDLGLLAMECEHLGRGDVAEQVMSTYRRLTNDNGFPRLEAFYRSLHACAQAVAAAQQRPGGDPADGSPDMADALGYLDQATRYAALVA